MTDRVAYDRYQARFFDVFKKFNGRLLSADENPAILRLEARGCESLPDKPFRSSGDRNRNLTSTSGYHPHGPKPKPNTNGNGVGA